MMNAIKSIAKVAFVVSMMSTPLFSTASEKESSKDVDVVSNFEMEIETVDTNKLEDVNNFSYFDKARFGVTVAKQLALIDDTYFIIPEEDADADYYALLRKPSVYFAMKKVKRYYRKSIKTNSVNKDEICEEFSDVLSKVYGLGFQNSQELESRLKATNNVEDMLELFARIEVK